MDKQMLEEMASLCHVMGHVTRLSIIKLLLDEKITVSSLAKKLNLHQSLVSQHLKQLRYRKICTFKREGQHIYYAIRNEYVETFFKDTFKFCQNR